jgi:hypothetical protein
MPNRNQLHGNSIHLLCFRISKINADILAQGRYKMSFRKNNFRQKKYVQYRERLSIRDIFLHIFLPLIFEMRDTHQETGDPARLPAQLCWAMETNELKKCTLVRKKIFCTGPIRAAKV